MTAMPPLRTIANGQAVDATDPEYNFTVLENHINSEMLNRDGSVAMVAPLTLSGLPASANHAANKAYVDSIFPVGSMIDYAGTSLPLALEGIWALCDGSSQSTSDPIYDDLFAAIGYAWGGAGGNFNLPDFRAKVSVGRHTGISTFDTVGETGGSADSVAAHVHTLSAHTHTMTHNHADTFATNSDGAHQHAATGLTANAAPTAITYPTGSSFIGVGATATLNAPGGTVNRTTEQPAFPTHDHAITMGGSVASSGAHTHAISGAVTIFTGSTAGPSTPNTGSTGVDDGNYPPYAVVLKLIKL